MEVVVGGAEGKIVGNSLGVSESFNVGKGDGFKVRTGFAIVGEAELEG
jgi:hypothetical protein